MMKSLSLCQKLGTFFLVLAVCVLAVGCGGSGVDALIKEQKAIMEDAKNAKGDPAKTKALQERQAEHAKKVNALSDAQKKEYGEKLAKEIGADFMKGFPTP